MQNDLSRGRQMFNGMSFGLHDLHNGRVASIATHTNNLLQWTSETTTHGAEVSLPISHQILNSNIDTYLKLTLLFQKFNKAAIDSSFTPGAATWQTWQNIMPALILPHWHHYVKTASSTKPEIHNVLYCRHGTEPRSHITCTENFGEIWTCVFLR